MEYIDHQFYCDEEEYNQLVSDQTKKFTECSFIFDSATKQQQIEYLPDTSNLMNCKKIYKTPSTNASTATKLLNPVNINNIPFDGSQGITIPMTNAPTATKLLNPVNINNVPFDGSQNITIPTSGGGIDVQPGASGNFLVSNGTQWTSKTKLESGVYQQYNGVTDTSHYTASYDVNTRILSITYAPGAGYHYKGTYYVLNDTQNPITVQTTAHTNAPNFYYVYINSSGQLTISTTPWDLDTSVPLYTFYYVHTNPLAPRVMIHKEHHPGINGMPIPTRKYLHQRLGTQLLSGCQITQGTGLNWTITSGVILDEDLRISTDPVDTAVSARIFNVEGTVGSQFWQWRNATNGIDVLSGNPVYNTISNGTWVRTQVATTGTKYFNQWILATNAHNSPQVIIIVPQNIYDTISGAQAEQFSGLQHINMFLAEYVVLYKITYKRANTNPVNQYYTNIESITQIQQSEVTVQQQNTVKQNIQQVEITSRINLIIPTTNKQILTSITVQRSGLYNVSYNFIYEYSGGNTYITGFVDVNGVYQRSFTCNNGSTSTGNSLSNQYAINLSAGDVVDLIIKKESTAGSIFWVEHGNLQIVQILQ